MVIYEKIKQNIGIKRKKIENDFDLDDLDCDYVDDMECVTEEDRVERLVSLRSVKNQY